MSLDLTAVGTTTKVHSLSYDWKTLATYALGVGAKRDELAFLYEGAPGGMRMLPTFGVVPSQAAVFDALVRSGGDLAMIVHGGQKIRVLAEERMPDHGTLETVGTLKGMFDLKKFAQVIVETTTTLDGAPVFETVWSIIFRGAGNFGGPRPGSGADRADSGPQVPKDREPTWTTEEPTSAEQALLYRISGDQNPLHADPAFAERVGFPQGPILHGLCTFGFLGRAVVKHACAGDPLRLKMLSAQFRKPVWPADTLIMQGHDIGDGTVALATMVKERSEAVLGSAWAEIAEMPSVRQAM